MGGTFSGCCCINVPSSTLMERCTTDVTLGSYPTLSGFEPNNECSLYGANTRRATVAIRDAGYTWRWLAGSPHEVVCYDPARTSASDFTGVGTWYADRNGVGSGIKTLSKMRIHYPAVGYLGVFNIADWSPGGVLNLSSSTAIAPTFGSPIEVFPDSLTAASGKIAISVQVFFFGLDDAGDIPAFIPNSFLVFEYP